MSEVERIEELPDGQGWLEYYSDGRIRAKDPDGKLMKHSSNRTPSKAASDIAKIGAQKAQDNTGEIGELLEYLGLDSPFDYQMAKLVIGGKQNAVAASKELMKAASTRGSFKSEHKQFDIKAGKMYMAQKVNDDVELQEFEFNDMGMGKIKDYIEYVRREHPEITSRSKSSL